MIRHHHERLDGRGYPDGLAGEDIPLGARIIAVADTFDAITSNRTYRRASHHKRALDVLSSEAGKQLDGDAVSAFRGYYRGQRTVALSAFIAAAPQRFLSWLGGASPAIGAGAASATSLLIGLGSSQPAVYSPDSAVSTTPAPLVASAPKRASVAAAEAARLRGPVAGERRSADGRRGGADRRAPSRTRRPGVTQPGGTAPAAGGGGTPAATQPGGGGSAPRPTAPQPGTGRPIVPGVDRPNVPGVRVPQVRTPEVKVPEVKVPGVKVPSVELPGITTPEITTPEIKVPEIKVPEIKTPEINLPGVNLP